MIIVYYEYHFGGFTSINEWKKWLTLKIYSSLPLSCTYNVTITPVYFFGLFYTISEQILLIVQFGG